tara:strand:- start:215 stop:433 length:219 start_codon:yes stop_codon:yes gene_type:complete
MQTNVCSKISRSSVQLIPTVVVDEYRKLLGFVFSSKKSIEQAIDTSKGVYQSRTRGLWVKGESRYVALSFLS